MQDISTRLKSLHRPPLLVHAARAATKTVTDHTLLRRVFQGVPPENTANAIVQILDLETDLNIQRKTGQATYALARHIDVLAALLALAPKHLGQRSV